MIRLPDPAIGSTTTRSVDTRAARVLACACLVLMVVIAPGGGARAAQPFVWDQDGNGIDDRVESVHALGFSASFEASDTTRKQRIQVMRSGPDLLFGVYVRWNRTPTATDLASLSLLGMPTLSRITAVPATRSLATFAQASAAAALPGVERVEAAPLLYPEVRDGAAGAAVRDPSYGVFPTLTSAAPGLQGHGIVIAFLDTGINDASEGAFPGHESLRGRALGGAVFVTADSVSQTPHAGSTNPSDHGGVQTHAHATHVAGIAVGAGAPNGFGAGIAPAARFIDIKALTDSGVGVAVPEALDWCIANRARDWGSPLAEERGIDIINLSLSSLDPSDGQDLASRLAARAVELGIVVVASIGNDGKSQHVPSPAAGDGVITVGAWDLSRTPATGDDAWPTFNNSGPRFSDGDGDLLDELKPDLLAPGVDVLSADGDVLKDGTAWQRLSGTSMSAAFVTGVCALLREADPVATPAVLTQRLRDTAVRPLNGAPDGVAGGDPRWRSTRGCGLVDAYAAWLEGLGDAPTQLRRLIVTPEDTSLAITLWTGRETGAAHIVLERALDQGGVPGVFTPVDSLPASGSASFARPSSITAYPFVRNVPPGERGARFWYRAAYTQAGQRQASAPRPATSPGGRRLATIEFTLVHDAFDSDLEVEVQAGFGPDGGPHFALGGSAEAVATDWVDGSSVTGSQAWTFRIAVPEGRAATFLPVGPGRPWTLRVSDGGSATRSGRIQDFRITQHLPTGDVTTVAQPLPRQTIEGATVEVRLPDATTGVGGPHAGMPLQVSPNPARAGQSLRLSWPAEGGSQARLYDLAGREVARIAMSAVSNGWSADWQARDHDGRALPPGLYLVRGGRGDSKRIILLGP